VDVIGLEMRQSAAIFEHDRWAGEHCLPHQRECFELASILRKIFSYCFAAVACGRR
jgi:hypothetical protein